jgi:SAM-dependent methyltransferase
MGEDWLPPGGEITRLDIDPSCNPDIVANMLDMGEIGQYDVVFSSHSLEHLYPHEVAQAMSEFYRVLVPGGHVVVVVPDLEDVRPTEDVLFESFAGPITGLDIIYGHRASIPDAPFMAHHTGFTQHTLREALSQFTLIVTKRLSEYNLMAVGQKH